MIILVAIYHIFKLRIVSVFSSCQTCLYYCRQSVVLHVLDAHLSNLFQVVGCHVQQQSALLPLQTLPDTIKDVQSTQHQLCQQSQLSLPYVSIVYSPNRADKESLSPCRPDLLSDCCCCSLPGLGMVDSPSSLMLHVIWQYPLSLYDLGRALGHFT